MNKELKIVAKLLRLIYSGEGKDEAMQAIEEYASYMHISLNKRKSYKTLENLLLEFVENSRGMNEILPELYSTLKFY